MRGSTTSLLLAVAITLGLLFPALAALARPLLLPAIFLLLLLPLLQMETGVLRGALGRPWMAIGIAAWLTLAMPWLAWFAIRLLDLPALLLLPLLVTACAGSIFSAPAFCRLLGLDDALALVAMLASTLLMPVALLVYGAMLLPQQFDLDLGEYLWRLAVFIVAPFLLAAVGRRLAGRERMRRVRQKLSGATVAVLVVFGLAIMDGVSAHALAFPREVVAYLLAAFGFNLAAQLLTALVFLPAGARVAATAALLAGYRNLGLVVGITAGMLDERFLIFVGIWQIPMYVLPLLMQPLYRRLR